MANDFSGDTNVQGLWNFESGALTTDDSGEGNTLNATGAPSEDTVNYKQGSCAANFEDTESDGYYISDASLSSDFPLKNGDTTKQISICFWMKPETVPGSGNFDDLVAKWDYAASKCSLEITMTNSKLRVNWGHTSGQQMYSYDTMTITAGRWYHVTIAIDGVSKSLMVYIYDDNSGTTTTYGPYTPANELRIVDCDFTIGCQTWVAGSGYASFFDGLLDEVVIFDRVLGSAEARAIRAGNYNEEVRLYNISTQVEYDETPQIRIAQLLSQVEYDETPQIRVSQVCVQVEYMHQDDAGPTQEQLLRHGTWFGNSAKQRMWYGGYKQ